MKDDPTQSNPHSASNLRSTSSADAQRTSPGADSFAISPPAVALPKGGGAIRGIGEKFSANPVTGTGSMSVPIAYSPGRAGFGPQLSLSYDSGAGNGPFGFGWSLSLPSITRKTDKGLPQYLDGGDSDVFILSGAEDLVPIYRQDPDGSWVANHAEYQRDVEGFWVREKATGRLLIHEDLVDGYLVRRYRPRIEGLFARIERWTLIAEPKEKHWPTGVHWRSISKDNILTLYGLAEESRIFDPLDKTRIFSWLISETRDDKGNAVVYGYEPENGVGVPLDRASERNRGRTANRYLKRIKYGNRKPLLDANGQRPRFLTNAERKSAEWMFEAVLDYGEHDTKVPTPSDAGQWAYRSDAFSSYRSGFEVRTTRLCQRVLMFHHFPKENDVGTDCLVRSTDFKYSHEQAPDNARNPIYTFLMAVTQNGYRRNNGAYDKRSLPSVTFEYTPCEVQDTIADVDPTSLENLPIGVDGSTYQWTDLHGEGIPGILTEQAGAWYYKRNISPASKQTVEFAPLECVASKPNLALAGGAQFMDLAGDGQPDLVVLDGPMPGLYEHDEAESWQPFRPFTSRLNRDLRDPNVKFVDLDGDGHADVLISEDDVLVWHASLAEAGFGPARRVVQALDEEKGPRVVFADGTQSIYLADLSGDGLTDIARIRNGEICYWPNLGYGRFGAKVTMDHAPLFDNPDQFNHKRLRLADIDGSGTTDIIYLHRDGVRLYFNQSGNAWSAAQTLSVFPSIDDVASIMTTDLLGNGTACLVWSSPLPGDARRPMRYVNLMGKQKPHLLFKTINNLGAETVVYYAPSTKFYLQDKRDGKPWITRLPFPAHVVERVETWDHISRSRFVTGYAYHHGYFDGDEREFRGFGMVEQWDTEDFAALTKGGTLPAPTNQDVTSHVPRVITKTWFHTGAYLGRERVSRQFENEYFRETGLNIDTALPLLLDDTPPLPDPLSLEEEREACRALKGSMLRQEVYADDAGPNATPEQIERAGTPYTVTEQNFTIRALQPRGANRHAVFFSHAREAISYHYERNPADPRIQHALTLEVDDYGNVLKQAAIGYGRRQYLRTLEPSGEVKLVPNPAFNGFEEADKTKQITPLLTYTENRVTNAIESTDTHRNPLPCEAVTFELTGYSAHGPEIGPATEPAQPIRRYLASDFVESDPAGRLRHKFTAPDVAYEITAAGNQRRRPIEWLRTLYRRDDMTGLLPLRELHPLALPGESYKLAFTPGLLNLVFQRSGQTLLPDSAAVLGGQAGNQGGYLQSQTLKADGRFPASDADHHWWIPSGQSFFSVNPADSGATELAEARQHFFLPRRYCDPFGQNAFVKYDANDLLILETRDALDNRVTVDANDYRVLQPRLVSDPNGNRTEVAFDTLGMVVGTAVMGKPLPAQVEGDTLVGFAADLTQDQLDALLTAPRQPSADPKSSEATPIVHDLLQRATTRIVYDLGRYQRLREPPFAATIARETHYNDLPKDAQGKPTQESKLQLSFSYSDGFGREIQKKIQAEPGPLFERGPVINPRWVGSGWTIFNNKGKPVRQYEPFFTDRHGFEFDVRVGVSPILFYDPVERVVATLHPNNTYEKVVFDPWQQTTWDVNDTIRLPQKPDDPPFDPKDDPDAGHYFGRLRDDDYLPTWYDRRTDVAKALLAWPDTDAQGNPLPNNVKRRTVEREAAAKAAAHTNTPTTARFDALGRPFLTLADNGPDPTQPAGPHVRFATRVELDIEGNQRTVRDAVTKTKARDPQGNEVEVVDVLGRIVMRYAYDMLGNRIYQLSMEAGARWMLNDVAGKPIRAWDSRGHNFTTTYDALRRPVEQTVRGTIDNGEAASDPRTLNRDILVDRIEYGEALVNAKALNLRTRIYRHFDSAGVATNARLNANGEPLKAYDFKGNLLRSTRRLAHDYAAVPDWLQLPEPQLDAEFFEGSTLYDALNRPIQSIAPHSSLTRPGHPNKINVIQPVFNEANLLERVDVWLELAAEPVALLNRDIPAEAPSPVGVHNIDYDAKGQRQRIDYKNGASTHYRYDEETFRLLRLRTVRGNKNAADCAPVFDPRTCQDPPAVCQRLGTNTCVVQDLGYTYDPAGNITHIQDDAQQIIYFKNHRVEPSNDYTYDALYRLIQATGREHLGQQDNGDRNPPTSPDAFNAFHTRLAHPGDGNAMGTYIERYVYDAVGNFLQMQHRGSDPEHAGWTRHYDYLEASLTEDGSGGAPLKTSNRLTRTTLDPTGNSTQPETYLHDTHGNMVRMPHLSGVLPGPNMYWDYKDQLRRTDLGGGGAAFYVYDASGQRVRKVVVRNDGNLIEERIYFGGFEIFRKHGGPIGVNSATLERETLHVMDDKQRIALVETRTLDTAGNDPAPRQLIRYQFGNHLGSASLELDELAQVISYEEYSPYGSTTYQAVRSQTETAKRYRYTGKERDEETGFDYFGARYYVPWLSRWLSCDPVGLKSGVQAYCYAANSPLCLRDPDGNFPAPYELADAWADSGVAPIPGVTGEKVSQAYSGLGDTIGNAIVDALPSDNLAGVFAAALVKTTLDVAGGVVGAVVDPGMVVRGVMRFGTGSAQGYNDIKAGNVVLGTSRIVGEVAQGVGYALGGVQGARSLGVGGTYQPAKPPPPGSSTQTKPPAPGATTSTKPPAPGTTSSTKPPISADAAPAAAKPVTPAPGASVPKPVEGTPVAYTPNRALPVDKQGVPVPDVDLPHSQLGRSKPKFGSEPQAREWGYGPNGKLQPMRDIDFTDHGTPEIHPNPHQHKLTPINPKLAPKGGFNRGGPKPL